MISAHSFLLSTKTTLEGEKLDNFFFSPLLKCHVSKVKERAGDILYANMKSVLLDKMQSLLQAERNIF